MKKILEKVFGTASERQTKKIDPIVDTINDLYTEFIELPDDEFKNQTIQFRRRITEQTLHLHLKLIEIDKEIEQLEESDELVNLMYRREQIDNEIFEIEQSFLEELLPEAFAAVKATCQKLIGTEFNIMGEKLVWDMVPFDVQLIGATILHQGRVTEMATGEGKTLVATMPLYLNALALNHKWVEIAIKFYGEDISKWDFQPFESEEGEIVPPGKGVHLVTVNDYLARRDAQWMDMIYNFLGITVGVIHEGIQPHTPERRAQYCKDIVYGTNNAFGFDYLRDNMAISPKGVVQRELYYAIIDEVDSILIDEARTPLIISGPVQSTISEHFKKWNSAVRHIVSAQSRESASLINESRQFWAKSKTLETEGKGGDADSIKAKAATQLLMVKRSNPKNPQFLKLIKEPDILKSINHEEAIHIRDKNMNELDEKLYFAVDEFEHSINLTDKGRNELARFSKADPEIFTLPDIAEELSQIEGNEELSEKVMTEMKSKLNKRFAERSEINHAISQLLKGYVLFAKDVDYVVQDDKVIIVDEFTGRLMAGRRYSEGLHQALEAKESVHVEGETQTYATITIQNYFRMYRKLAGMTGTALTESSEFWEIYKLEVISIPTNRPVRREDCNDQVYLTRKEKFDSVIDDIAYYHKRNQPVLVGTVSVEVSEMLSRMLKRKQIPHSVLNAKYHEKEAHIITLAGQPGAVTIATNMAGRGTDIKLGMGLVKAYKLVFEPILLRIAKEIEEGKSFLLVTESREVLRNLAELAKYEGIEFREFNLRENSPNTIAKYLSNAGNVAIFSGSSGFVLAESIPKGNFERINFPKPKCALLTHTIDQWTCPENPKECIKKGVPCGLHIIGTERHNARRIDNQLRGRAGRQGDPGSSRFMVSLQDDLMRLYAGGDRAYNMIKRLNPPEGEPIEHTIISRQIAGAQKRVEIQNFAIRKRALEHDDVMNKHREVIYSLRHRILFGNNLKPDFKKFIFEFCEFLVENYTDSRRPPESWDWAGLSEEFTNVFLLRYNPEDTEHESDSLVEELYELAIKAYNMKEYILSEENCRLLEKLVMLKTLDNLWMEHLRSLDDIKESSYLMAYAQKDPIVEYKMQSFEAFGILMDDLRKQTLYTFFHAQVALPEAPRRRIPTRITHQESDGYGVAASAQMAQKLLGSQDRKSKFQSPHGIKSPGRQNSRMGPIQKTQTIRKGRKIGRNEPCPCGSGKKYKHCCGKNV